MPDDQVQYDPSQFPMIPGRANTLAAMMPGVLPPNSPVQPVTTLQESMLQASEQARQTVAEQIARARANAAQQPALLARQQAMSLPQSPENPEGIPKMGFAQEPWMQMQPITGEGFGHGAKELIADIGRGLLRTLFATAPGRAVEGATYGPGMEHYEARKAEVTKQIKDIQKQQELEQAPLGAAAGMIYHPIMAGASEKRAEAEAKRAESYKDYVTQIGQFHDALVGIYDKRNTLKGRELDIKEELGKLNVDMKHEGNMVILKLGGQRVSVDAQEWNAAIANKSQEFFPQVLRRLGLREFFQVDLPESQAGVAPLAGQPPGRLPPAKPAARPAAPGTAIQVTAPNGKTYSFPTQRAADNFKREAGIK